ncbi:MAG: hypothetical protein E4G96_00005 [Chrysiogenales bacterium]|nr:MAG: hypothetical protein E4G96_00005 [Chrysiogenales bacterium]
MRLLLVLLVSSHLAAPGECRVSVTVPPGISLSHEVMAAALPRSIVTRKGYDEAEIVVYHYTQGVESYHFGEEGPFKESLSSGVIECLVKLKIKDRLVRALFIHAGGPDLTALLSNLSRALSVALAKH